jgi:hypothetical protein
VGQQNFEWKTDFYLTDVRAFPNPKIKLKEQKERKERFISNWKVYKNFVRFHDSNHLFYIFITTAKF